MKSKFLAVICSAVMIFSMSACGGGENASADNNTNSGKAPEESGGEYITVGFSQVGAESDWRTANTVSMQTQFSEENGYKLIFDDAQQKQENQITAIRNFIQQEVDYIVLAPVTESGWDTVLKEAKDADIPVIIVDRMVDVSDENLYTAWVGSDFRAEGDKAAAWIEKEFAGKDEVNIVHIQGTIGSSAQIGRTEGLEAGAEKNSNWKIIAKQTGEFTQAKGQEVMESVLKQFSDTRIDVVYCENDNEAFGAIDAIEAAGKSYGLDNETAIISFDGGRAAMKMCLDGEINYIVECNPLHGPRVDKIIQQLEKGETPEKIAYVDEGTFDAREMTEEILESRAF